MTKDQRFRAAMIGDTLRGQHPVSARLPGDMCDLLKEIERAELKAEVAQALK